MGATTAAAAGAAFSTGVFGAAPVAWTTTGVSRAEAAARAMRVDVRVMLGLRATARCLGCGAHELGPRKGCSRCTAARAGVCLVSAFNLKRGRSFRSSSPKIFAQRLELLRFFGFGRRVRGGRGSMRQPLVQVRGGAARGVSGEVAPFRRRTRGETRNEPSPRKGN